MHDKTGSGTMTSLTSAVVLPGRGYPVDGPLLFFAQVALRRRGIDVTAIRWSPPPDLDAARAPDWVAGQLEPALAAGAGRSWWRSRLAASPRRWWRRAACRRSG